MAKKTDDLYLTDIAKMVEAFYKDADEIGTTDALLKVIEKAYHTGREHGKANA